MTTDQTKQILTDAKAIIDNEERWTHGALFVSGDGLERDPLCGNTKCCALGAVGIAAFGAPFVNSYLVREDEGYDPDEGTVRIETADGSTFWSEMDDFEGFLMDHEKTSRAVKLLNAAAAEIEGLEESLARPSIVDLNDHRGSFLIPEPEARAAAYAKVRRAFEMALAQA